MHGSQASSVGQPGRAIGYAPGHGQAVPIVSRVTIIGKSDPAPSEPSNLEAFSC